MSRERHPSAAGRSSGNAPRARGAGVRTTRAPVIRTFAGAALAGLMSTLVPGLAWAPPIEPAPVRAVSDSISSVERRPAGSTAGYRHEIRTDPAIVADVSKARLKSDEETLRRRWLELSIAARGADEIQLESFADRVLERYFPNTTFYRLRAVVGDQTRTAVACESLGRLLVLPHEINFLCILEGRTVSRHNVRPLSEAIARMLDPDGSTSQKVIDYSVARDRRDPSLATVTLDTWSYRSGFRMRWTIGVREPYFHSLEENLLSVRPGLLEDITPEQLLDLQDDEFEGALGREKYIGFWRNPSEREEMRAHREVWLAARRESRE